MNAYELLQDSFSIILIITIIVIMKLFRVGQKDIVLLLTS